MPLILVSEVGSPNIRLDKPILLIGRNSDCDVVIESKKVSRQHCCLCQVNNKLVIRDLGSTNGVRVNGQRQDECDLAAGDELQIGDSVFRLEREDPSHRAPKSAPNQAASSKAAPSKAAPRPVEKNWTDADLEESDSPVPLADEALPKLRPITGEEPGPLSRESTEESGEFRIVPAPRNEAQSDSDDSFPSLTD